MPRNFINRLKRIDSLIQQNKTGTSLQLSQKLDVSERTIKEYFKIMRELGAPIYFNRRYKSYAYKEPGSFNISFVKVQ